MAGAVGPANFALTNAAPRAPASIVITGGNNQTVQVGAAFAPLQVEVNDINGSPWERG